MLTSDRYTQLRMYASPFYYRLSEEGDRPWYYIGVHMKIAGRWPTPDELDFRNAMEDFIKEKKIAVPDGGGAGMGGMDLYFFSRDVEQLKKEILQYMKQNRPPQNRTNSGSVRFTARLTKNKNPFASHK